LNESTNVWPAFSVGVSVWEGNAERCCGPSRVKLTEYRCPFRLVERLIVSEPSLDTRRISRTAAEPDPTTRQVVVAPDPLMTSTGRHTTGVSTGSSRGVITVAVNMAPPWPSIQLSAELKAEPRSWLTGGTGSGGNLGFRGLVGTGVGATMGFSTVVCIFVGALGNTIETPSPRSTRV
jgi:hypothetical protein